jgi:chromate transporter
VSGRLAETGWVFLKLGVIGFGGPAAHTAMMRDEVVRRRGWLDDGEFLELVGATNLIPGPNSTELAIHLGHRRAGWRGLLLAGLCFIGPAVLIVATLAWAYEQYGTDAVAVDLRYGILPVIVAIVAHATVGLARSALTGAVPVAVAVAASTAYLLDVHELVILVVAGLAHVVWTQAERLRPRRHLALLPPVILAQVAASAEASLWQLFLVFLEIGSLLYGSGYVLLAFLEDNLVEGLGWLTTEQLLDAVAVGQVTPGPVFTTATFVGWQVAGPAGAAVATIGIFLPSFVFVSLLSVIVPLVRRHATARAFLDGVVFASLGLLAGVLLELVGAAVTDVLTGALAIGALGVLVRTEANSAWLVAAGAAVGAAHAVAT